MIETTLARLDSEAAKLRNRENVIDEIAGLFNAELFCAEEYKSDYISRNLPMLRALICRWIGVILAGGEGCLDVAIRLELVFEELNCEYYDEIVMAKGMRVGVMSTDIDQLLIWLRGLSLPAA